MEGSSSSRYGGGFVRLGTPRAAAQLALLAHNSSKDMPHIFGVLFYKPRRRCRDGSTWGLGGIKPPYLPNTHGYPPKPPLDFWDETMKRKRGGRRREGEEEEEEKERKKKRVNMSPSMFLS